MAHPDVPIVEFHQLIQPARPPQRADRSACGTLPTRAFQYCEAVTSATSYGWWIFPPTNLQLLWQNSDMFWKDDEFADWMPLKPSAQFPGFAAKFDHSAPADLEGCSPPFLTALPEEGTLQIWTGLFARTISGWHLLIRAPANLPSSGGYMLYEGIVEADRWFGPLFTTLRFTRSDRPVHLRADFPLLQVQPIPSYVYSNHTLHAMVIKSNIGTFSSEDWSAYRHSIVVPNQSPERAQGGYAADVRRSRRSQVSCSRPIGAS